MSDNDQLDVLVAVYLIPELAQQDFDSFVKLAEEKAISTDGVVLVTKDAEGEVAVQETGDHLGHKGVKVGGGVGLVVGLFAPPLLAATAIGAAAGGVVGKVTRKRVQAGIGEKMDEALPPGSSGVIAIYDHDDADAVAGGARELHPLVDRTDRQGLSEGAEGGSRGSLGRARGMSR